MTERALVPVKLSFHLKDATLLQMRISLTVQQRSTAHLRLWSSWPVPQDLNFKARRVLCKLNMCEVARQMY